MIGVVNAKAGCRFGALALLLAAVGCGKSTDAGGKAGTDTPVLTGTVRLGDKTLTHGAVAFHLDSGRVLRAVIKSDGSYEVHNPPAGRAKIVVTGGPPPVGVSGGGKNKELKLEQVDIPARYADPTSTDLEYEITAGKQTHNVTLKP